MHSLTADYDAVLNMYRMWKEGTDAMAGVEGIFPTLVLQATSKSATTVAKTNGIGNTWGVDNSKAYISAFPATN
jgi:hypothetical protein